MHIARLGILTFLLGVVITDASCRLYDDDGVPIQSSTWTWMCDDGSLAPDAGCPDGGDVDGGDVDGGSGSGDDDRRQAR